MMAMSESERDTYLVWIRDTLEDINNIDYEIERLKEKLAKLELERKEKFATLEALRQKILELEQEGEN